MKLERAIVGVILGFSADCVFIHITCAAIYFHQLFPENVAG
jgi:hypothetical protein